MDYAKYSKHNFYFMFVGKTFGNSYRTKRLGFVDISLPQNSLQVSGLAWMKQRNVCLLLINLYCSTVISLFFSLKK